MKVIFLVVSALCLGTKLAGQNLATNVLIPSSRIYGYTTGQQGAVKITSVQAAIQISDTVARTTLRLQLENTTAIRQEAEVILPVPEGAVVCGLAYEGPAGQGISAQVLPKDQARQIYNSLVAKIKDPALAEFIGYNLIRTSIFPLEPRARLKMEITYEHVLKVDGNRIEYSIPRTESLQYEVPWQIRAEIHTAQPICAVYSPSHVVYTNRVDANTISVIIEQQAAYTPGPFQLEILLETDVISASLMAYPEGLDDGYFLLLVGITSQVPEDPTDLIKREVTLVLDRSGSMAGRKIIQARDAAKQVISGLANGEGFNLYIFNDRVQQFASGPVPKNTATELQAHQYLDAVTASGSTNIYEALRMALQQPPLEGMLPLVLFLTDGLPTSGITLESAIRDLVIGSNPYNRRVYTFGVGYDLNAPLLESIAYASRAQPVFVRPEEDVEAAVTKLFRNLEGPVLINPRLVITTTDGMPATGRVLDVLPVVLPDLYKGERLVILGRYLRKDPVVFRITGKVLGQEGTFEYTFGFDKADPEYGFIPRLWASRRIAELIGVIRELGADKSLSPNDPRIVEVAQTIVGLSIRFGIITEYTAFLAREGTSLGDLWQVIGNTADQLYSRGAADRSGAGAVNQGLNMAMQRSQDVLNRDNSYLNSQMERERIVNTQQANDLTFYYKNGRWVDSRLVDIADQVDPHLTIEYGTDAFFQIAEALATEDRQGALAFAQDVLVLFDGKIILIDIPADVEEQYKPIDPARTTEPPPVRAGR